MLRFTARRLVPISHYTNSLPDPYRRGGQIYHFCFASFWIGLMVYDGTMSYLYPGHSNWQFLRDFGSYFWAPLRARVENTICLGYNPLPDGTDGDYGELTERYLTREELAKRTLGYEEE